MADPYYNLAGQMQGMVNPRKEENFIKYQLDASDEIDNLKAELLGLAWDDDKEEYVPSDEKEPLMSKTGANTLLAFLRPRVTKIFSLSNHDQQDINIRCRIFIDDISIMLTRHRKEWQIKSFSILSNIIDLSDDVFRATVLKSHHGWEGDGIRKQQTFVESRETINDNRQKAPLPFTMPFSRRK